jgi:hypothetical protein
MKKLLSLIILTLAVLSLSSCSSINEVDQDKVKDVSDKITEAIIDTVGKEKAERKESHTLNAENINTLKIKSSVGDINISTHESKDAIINLNIAAQTGSKEKSEQLIKDFSYSVEDSLNSIVVDTSFKDIKFDDSNVSTDLTIAVPSNIENIIIDLNVGDISIKNINGTYEIENNVGNINIKNSQASYDIKTNVGEITLTEAAAEGSSEFITNTGDINALFNKIENADRIKASTDVGDINITLPDDSSYEAVINEFMEKEKTESNKDKHTKIELKTGVGTIEFN